MVQSKKEVIFINTSKINVGDVIKNYKELCSILGEKPTSGGDKKKAHIKEIQRFVDYEKKGHKFVIKDIYKTPKDAEVVLNKVQYKSLIEELVMHLLMIDDKNKYHNEEGKAYITKNNLLLFLKAVNENYVHCRGKMEKTSKFLDIDIRSLDIFYKTTQRRLVDHVESALKSLSNKKLITFFSSKNVVELNGNNGYYEDINIDEFGNESVDIYEHQEALHREATEEEYKKIANIELSVLKEYGADDVWQIYSRGLSSEYYKKVRVSLRDELGIDRYYDTYKILYTTEDIEYGVKKFALKNREYSLKSLQLNKGVYDRDKVINSNNILRAKKKKEKSSKEAFILTEQYCKDHELILKTLVGYGERDIYEDVFKTIVSADEYRDMRLKIK